MGCLPHETAPAFDAACNNISIGNFTLCTLRKITLFCRHRTSKDTFTTAAAYGRACNPDYHHLSLCTEEEKTITIVAPAHDGADVTQTLDLYTMSFLTLLPPSLV